MSEGMSTATWFTDHSATDTGDCRMSSPSSVSSVSLSLNNFKLQPARSRPTSTLDLLEQLAVLFRMFVDTDIQRNHVNVVIRRRQERTENMIGHELELLGSSGHLVSQDVNLCNGL
eukprot:GILJ01005455.1.p2 GENE.GILJ01005455.1~~GILJ01005455.1.p2  ORF type:complete len:116 (-),score=6.93 GILJ01005455.1:315-662(-)